MKWRAWYIVFPATIALGGIAVASYFWYAHSQQAFLRTDPGTPRGCAVVDTPQGPIAVVLDHVAHGRSGKSRMLGARAVGDRMVAVDARTGAQLALTVRDDGFTECWGAASARMWCRHLDEVDVVDVPGFAKIASTSSLLAKAGLAAPLKHSWRADGSAIVTKLADGGTARVDAATLTATAVPDESISGAQPPTKCQLESSLDLGNRTRLKFGSGTRAPLVLDKRDEPPVTFDATFLSPKFLVTGDPAVTLVVHAAALDSGQPMNLTRLDADHHVQWTATVPGECETAHVTGSVLVLSTTVPTRRALGIDLATGKIIWELTFSE